MNSMPIQRSLPSWSRVLVVVAHPDDESFGLGAVIDSFTSSGSQVNVLCFTRGEASTIGWVENLAQVRAGELAAAGGILGVSGFDLLDYPDGGLDRVEADRLADEVVGRIQARPADGILTFDPSGITGHPDHTAATRAALAASQRSGVPALGWTIPDDVARGLNGSFGTAMVGHAPSAISLSVEVSRATQRRACHAHASQAEPGSILHIADHHHPWAYARVHQRAGLRARGRRRRLRRTHR